MQKVWLSESVFSMDVVQADVDRIESRSLQSTYQEWKHAEIRLAGNGDKFDRKDALAALNRAALQRIQALKTIYNLKKIPGVDQKSGNTKILHEFGIARSTALDIIRDLRNRVEHELYDPPSLETCIIYLDTVWYFLRSTDVMASKVSRGIWVLDPHRPGDICMTIDCAPPEWNVNIECDMRNPLVTFDKANLDFPGAAIPIRVPGPADSRIEAFRAPMADETRIKDFVSLYFRASHAGM